MHKFTSSLGLFLAVASLAFAAPSPAESSVPAALVRANGALIKAGASPGANDAGHSSPPKFPPKKCFSSDLNSCQPGWICCQGVCYVGTLCPDSDKGLAERV
ncbi:uncharacterized protein LACBIDRAFT_325126 [Laccaria bicolor S238N-H82]|uniref:Predicted protein n=1 Tax=Laccaria bicolor (strain S238N-H82 / ATCC MYA-4686) TaxID=486041 RepID=B0D589_LACBS|nr:uncharacterized protein LACBIDRAFT_325126 [Laccaria bicolor S238N-H82]EDR10236.1 predicted protein [Laccaria bicolor S238N-H82]|eukprot:XP_001878686.1 predicted protein [Laccaria bicolor S238N-H82]